MYQSDESQVVPDWTLPNTRMYQSRSGTTGPAGTYWIIQNKCI